MPFVVRNVSLLVAIALLLSVSTVARSDGMGDAAQALAAPLAQQFGVPASAVTTLLNSGASLESVTQMLLVSQSANKPLDEVSKLRTETGSVAGAAKKLKVPEMAYSEKATASAIDKAKQQAQADAAKRATDGVGKALDSALGGWKR